MHYIVEFLIGFAASFLGSLPVGMLNLTVMDISIRRGPKYVTLFSGGAASVEFIQAFIGVYFSSWFLMNQNITLFFEVMVLPLFLTLAIVYFFKDKSSTGNKAEIKNSEFAKGVWLSFLNPLPIPFWIFYATYFHAEHWISFSTTSIIVFVLGIAAGTFTALLAFGKMSIFIASKIKKINAWINKIIASAFFVLFIYQGISMALRFFF
ncbi:MAG: LysE family transporter [Hyphomicrobiales bacterium]